MPISTYAELKTEIAEQLKRSDLTARLATYIHLAEARMNRLLRVRAMQTLTTVTPSTTVKTLALPTGWMEKISFTDDLGDELEVVGFDELAELGYAQGQARPRYYAINDVINFDRVADAAHTYTMVYMQRMDLASALNVTLTTAPDVYLYGALMAAALDIKDDQRAGAWGAMFKSAINELNHQAVKGRRTLRTEFGGRGFNIIRGD